MRNYKMEKKLVGDENWPNISFVSVKGVPGQESASEIKESSEREKVIQAWNNIAVMKATSEKPTKFFIGFLKGNNSQYLKHEFTTDLEFGMRVGPEDVNFIVLPVSFEDKVNLELTELTTEADPKYPDLLLV
ncbi:MAG: hypothetical protein WC737_05280 [Parcubacteria group bacterium]